MSKGKRYDKEPKLNMKKVFAVIIAILVVIMFIFIIKGILTKGEDKGKISSKSYFTVYKDEKYGVIDSNGNTVIDPAYKELIVIPNSKNDVFICTYDVDYSKGTYKTKALNSKNEEIFTEYENVEAIQNIDENNNIWYEDNVLKIQKDGKFGLINLTGKVILEPQYEEIIAVEGIKNSLKIQKDGKFGIASAEGKIIIEPQYADITNLGKDDKSGYIVKSDDGKFGIVDYSAKQVLEAKYDEIKKISGNDLYVVKQNDTLKVVGKDGNDIITQGFNDIKQILSNQEDGVIYIKDNKYGVMKSSGEVTINAEYEELKEAQKGILIAKKDGKYGAIDLEKNEKIPFKYNTLTYNEVANLYIAEDENYNADIINSNYEVKLTGILSKIDTEKGYMSLRIGEEYKYYNFKFEEKQLSDIFTSNTLFLSKKDGKYGFVDKEGKVIVDYIYDDATEQNSCGYAAIKKDGKWGSIDSKGNIVQEPTYNLDNYFIVDFIGRWHMGKDINMNYYNQE